MNSAQSDLPPGADGLLRAAGFAPPFACRRLFGGRNNRVFAVTAGDGRMAVIKAYFHDPADPRDRLASEYEFLTAAARLELACVPKPLGRSDDHHLGLYSFVAGSPVAAEDLTPAVLAQAMDFIVRLNDRSRIGELPSLPDVADVAWSAAEHIAKVDRRLARIMESLGDSAIERDARKFVTEDIAPKWARIRTAATADLEKIGLPADRRLPQALKVLSPADFGFQNALKGADGRIIFLDFEYAGWDDPAKFVADTFNQFTVPLPESFYPMFRDTVAGWFHQPDVERRRYDIMLPVHGIKWVAIILNEFVPASNLRRAYADADGPAEDKRATQLAKAHAKLAGIQAKT